MSDPMAPSRLTGADRHASWLELFFDLVAIAGIGALAHLLEEDSSRGGVAVYVIAFAAIWMIWSCFTVYGNIAGDEVHTLVILGAMFVLGVMIAAIPEIRGEHATAFAVAYVVGRFLAGRPWKRSAVVVDLPVVQTGAGIIPWVVSFWFDGTAQYALWAVGLALDLLFLVSTNRDRLIAGLQDRLERHQRPSRPAVELEAADVDVPHLGERLGLFILIVIGEGLIQIIGAAGEGEWDRSLALSGAGAFALMFGLWALAVRFGYAGVALLPEGSLPSRVLWPAHLVSALAIATVAAMIGGLVAESHEELGDHVRWILLAAYLGYAVVSAGFNLASGAPARAGCLVPLVVAGVVVAVAPGLAAVAALWILAAGVLGAVAVSIRTKGSQVT